MKTPPAGVLTALLPCPFCGGKPIRLEGDGQWTQIGCDSCGGKGTEYQHDWEKATAAWNRRVPAPAQQAEGQERDSIGKQQMREIARQLNPEVTDAKFNAMWARFTMEKNTRSLLPRCDCLNECGDDPAVDAGKAHCAYGNEKQ